MVRLISLLTVILLTGTVKAEQITVREQRQVTVAGKPETWRLAWHGPVRPACGPEEVALAITNPCIGIAYGEQGQLFLERVRPDSTIFDRLDLSPTFDDSEFGDRDYGNAVLQRWPMKLDDMKYEGAAKENYATFVAAVRARPVVTVMQLADYDRDGVALEFLFQADAAAGGKRYYAAAGIDPIDNRLRLLRSSGRPDRPLLLNQAAWQALAESGAPTEIAMWACDDHGSEVALTYFLSARNGRISVKMREYVCQSSGTAESPPKEQEW